MEGTIMAGRPEGSAGGYDERGPDEYDRNAWQEFTPWRPGDPSTMHEAPPSYASDFSSEGLYLPSTGNHEDGRGVTPPASSSSPGGPAAPERKPFRWSEDSRRLQEGDQVRATRAMGDGLMNTVRPGAKGRVVRTEHGLLGGRRGDVQFETGYTIHNVDLDKGDSLERRGWLD
jgi:hypothetical protein